VGGGLGSGGANTWLRDFSGLANFPINRIAELASGAGFISNGTAKFGTFVGAEFSGSLTDVDPEGQSLPGNGYFATPFLSSGYWSVTLQYQGVSLTSRTSTQTYYPVTDSGGGVSIVGALYDANQGISISINLR
jgi:hypothetical protein